MKLAVYFLKHRTRTSRATTAADITLDQVRGIRDLRQEEENHDDVEAPKLDNRDWPKTMEAIIEYLRGCLGVTGIPLAYVVRSVEEIPAGADVATGYSSKQDEMIARAPHRDGAGDHLPTFLTDRQRVWDLIAALTREQDCWTYVKPAQRTRNGRLAFMGLWNHFLGPNNVDNMATTAERKLSDTTYVGEKNRWNFEKYVRTQQDQHQVLEGLVHYGYAGIDERSKVRHLVDGIKTTSLDSVKTRIMSEATLRSNFAGCVSLFKDFLKQAGNENPEMQIAAAHSGEQIKRKIPGADSGPKGPKTGVEDRYYTNQEYERLLPPQKKELKEIRSHRGDKGNSNGKKSKGRPTQGQRGRQGGGSNHQAMIAMTSTISQLASHITGEQKEEEDAEEESDADTEQGSNRTNSALTRQRIGKKKK